jgi:hypothetical protein
VKSARKLISIVAGLVFPLCFTLQSAERASGVAVTVQPIATEAAVNAMKAGSW